MRFMCACMCVYISTDMCVYTSIYIQTHIHEAYCNHTGVLLYIHVLHVCVCICIYTYIHAYMKYIPILQRDPLSAAIKKILKKY